MQLPNDVPPPCALCETKRAVKAYTLAGHTEMVCATCFDRWSLQDVLEGELLHILDLKRAGRFDEALALLDAILKANRDRDHDAWLARSIADHRMMIFFRAGRYAEAFEAGRVWEQLGFADVSERWMHATATAQALEAMGRDREAVTALEDSLGYEDEKYLPSALGVLTELVRFSEKLGESLDPKWLRLTEAVAKHQGVEMPAADSPAGAILALEEILRSRQ